MWDSTSTHFVATRGSDGRMRTRAANGEIRIVNDVDMYFAPANFKTSSDGRKQSNVASVRAFWLDIDCKNDGYSSKEEALEALLSFCTTVAPKPSAIVDSGGGIHVYWILDHAIEPTEWQHAAKRLRQACVEHGLRADHSRTTDYSSLMRIPGSVNQSVRAVATVIFESDSVTLDEFTARMPPIRVPSSDAEFTVPFNTPPGDAHQIADRCAAMGQIRELRGNVQEPLWYAGLQVIAHCANAEHIAIEWSNGHPEFSIEETLEKLARASHVGPTTCERFEALGAPCGACPFHGKITSPIRLGREATPIPSTSGAAVPQPQMSIPQSLSHKYTIGKEGVWYKGGGDEDEASLVVWVPLVVDGIGQQNDGGAIAQVRWVTPQGTYRSGDLPLTTLADNRELTRWMLDRAITFFNKEKLSMYLRDYTTAFLNKQDPSPIVGRFGWHEDMTRFFLGDRLIGVDKTVKVRVAQHVPTKMINELSPVGDAAKWASATAGLDQYPSHAFALLASLASPVLHLCSVQGAVLSLAGESGFGKTVATKFATSVWGMPDALQVAPQATQNAKGEMFRLARHLPVLIDDVTQAQFQQMSELIYMAANGRAKERVNREGRIRGSDDWQLVALVTTNSPLHEMSHKLLGEAERKRVLELTIQDPMPREQLMAMITATQNHPGSVAEPYLRALESFGVDNVRTMFKSVVDRIHSGGVPDTQRFGVWLAAAATVAGVIAQEAGIILFDPIKVVKHITSGMVTASDEELSPTEKTERLIAEYINKHIRNFTIKARNTWIDTDVYGPVAGTIKVDACVVAIPTSRLLDWFQQHRMPTVHLKRWMKSNGVNRYLELMARTGAREYCYQIPMDHEQIEALKGGRSGS